MFWDFCFGLGNVFTLRSNVSYSMKLSGIGILDNYRATTMVDFDPAHEKNTSFLHWLEIEGNPCKKAQSVINVLLLIKLQTAQSDVKKLVTPNSLSFVLSVIQVNFPFQWLDWQLQFLANHLKLAKKKAFPRVETLSTLIVTLRNALIVIIRHVSSVRFSYYCKVFSISGVLWYKWDLYPKLAP